MFALRGATIAKSRYVYITVKSYQSYQITPTSTRDLLRAELNAEYEELEKEVQMYVKEGFEELLAEPFRLHVSNIPFRYTEKHLKSLLSSFGPVLDVEIITNQRGSKGFGFVTMQHKTDAERATKMLDGLVLNGRKIEINDATPRKFIKNFKKTNLVQATSSSTSNLVEFEPDPDMKQRSQSMLCLKSLPAPSQKRFPKKNRYFRA